MSKVLIIDDENDIRDVFAEAFRLSGYEVCEAANGMAGLRVFDAEGPDVVVVDVFMPEKDGIETLLEIRMKNRHVPIIAMSGGGASNHFQFLDMTEKLGANLVLKKPILPRDLVTAASNCIAGKD
tara:strand:- start:5259 stop:5633 length:375 start_codon:yes stop_codon:yes gene_type:complete